MHHPPDWLVEYENPDFGRGLEQDFRFLLHGHEHRAWVQPGAGGYTVLAAAACYERSEGEHNGYNMVRLDPEAGRGEVWLRRFEAGGGGWIPCIIAGRSEQRPGVWELELGWLTEAAGRDRATPEPQEERQPVVESPPPRGEDDPEMARYLQRLRAAHCDLPVAGFETRVRLPIRLDQVYVPLRARVYHEVMERKQRRFGASKELVAHVEQDRDVPFDEALRVAAGYGLRGAVVLGDPGSGKTTLLKHFVLAATDPALGPATVGLPPATIPVFIELRRLDRPAAGLRTALEEAVARADIGVDSPSFAQELICRDQLLILVDGLDEVADAAERAAVSRWLEEAIRQLPGSTFVVTSRYAGYKGDARLSGHFLELHVRDLSEDAVRRFINAWYHAVESQAQLGREAEVADALAREAAADLAEKIFDPEDPRTSTLRLLATNPLMLQILCLVHRDRKTLPEKRVELYRECALVLLELWRRAKGMPLDFLAQEALRLLQPLAYWLHVGERKEAQLEEVLPHLEEPLRALGRRPEDGGVLLQAIRDQSGVVVSLGQGAYGFLHLSFQEYLCARHVQDRALRDPAVLRRLAEHFGEPWWREVILLAMGLDTPNLFEPLMEQLLELEVLHRDVRLADDCLRDALETTPRPFLEALARGVADPAERYHVLRLLRALPGWKETDLGAGLSARELVAKLVREDRNAQVRSIAAEMLGIFEPIAAEGQVEPTVLAPGERETRERVNEKDGTVLVYVPGGEFTLGADDVDEDSKPIHQVVLSPFWIAKYPVTNEQYRRYLEADSNQRKPELWDEKEFNQPQQPVVGVSWEEAVAYCRWAGLELPSEAQWEAAARGQDQRRYPWGNAELTASLANFGGTEGKTTPVDSYPGGAGPYGTLDQAGNVWEWCADVWDASAYRGREGQLDPVATTGEAAVRVLRGGSWADPPGDLAAASRDRDWAGHRDRCIGFRGVLRVGPEH
ncbi:MAG: SUMF1/EgtB/PvdO family nonheme iron enzyme, partial [bacterium]|nr:SUMF1/EgtB/PvdO family nonheme iron enzyme [bacterium]